MVIDELVSLFGFKIDERTLNKYKRIMKGIEGLTDRVGRKGQQAFDKIKPAVARAGASVSRLSAKTKELRHALKRVGITGVATFGAIGSRIRRTVTSMLRLKSLIGVSVAGLLGFKAASAVLDEGGIVERQRMMLRRFESAEGDSPKVQQQKAGKAEKFITDLALATPLTVKEVTDAFIDMKQRGMEPAKGMLLDLINVNAAYGGTAYDLKLILLQLGQAWGKNKLQGQDLRILLEKRIPLLKALEKITGKNVVQIYKMVEAGKINREVLKQAINLMGKESAGAAKEFAASYTGMIGRLRDFRELFIKFINDSGLFPAVIAKLKIITDELAVMYKTGKLKKYAKVISDKLVVALQGLWNWLKKTVKAIANGETMVQRLAAKVGGLANLFKILVGIAFTGWLSGALVSAGLLVVSVARLIFTVGKGILALRTFGIVTAALSIGLGGLKAIVLGVGVALKVGLTAAFSTVGLVIIAVSTAVYLLIDNWQYLKTKIIELGLYLSTTFPTATAVAVAALNGLKNLALLLVDPFVKLYQLLMDLPGAWATLKDAGEAALNFITDKATYAIDKLKEMGNAVKEVSKSFLDNTVGKVGEFLGETAAKVVIGSQNLLGGDAVLDGPSPQLTVGDIQRSLQNGPLSNPSPLTPTVDTSAAQRASTTSNDNSSTANITVHGATGNPNDTANAITTALRDQSAITQRKATTSIGY